MISAGQIDAMISRYGQSVTLRRLPSTDVALSAVVRGYAPHEIVPGGPVAQGDRLVRIGTAAIAAAAWPAPPHRDDKILLGSDVTTVRAVEALQVAGVVVEYVLQVRG